MIDGAFSFWDFNEVANAHFLPLKNSLAMDWKVRYFMYCDVRFFKVQVPSTAIPLRHAVPEQVWWG